MHDWNLCSDSGSCQPTRKHDVKTGAFGEEEEELKIRRLLPLNWTEEEPVCCTAEHNI